MALFSGLRHTHAYSPIPISSLRKRQTMHPDDELDTKLDALADAIETENKEAVIEWIHRETFTLVSLGSDDGATAAMILETETFPALVAFLNSDLAEEFVDSIADQIEGESVEMFEVSGEDLLAPLTSEFGLLINPESEDAVLIDPSFLHDEDADTEDDSE